jgi:F-type H+-transporting ATPase subunit a
MAYMGMIPFFKSPIALNLNTPLSIAICVFLFVQYHGIRQNGPGGYIKHLMGEPAWLAPLQMPLHVVGEFIKPVSLSLRLYANITAEDVLIAALAFMLLGLPAFVPIPLQTLFFPLAMLFGFIQALVFMSLSAIYISQMSAHGEHHDEHAHH